MSRKKDPILSVLEFFEEQSVEVTQMALGLVKAIVRRRTPAPTKPKRAPRKKPDGQITAAPVPPLPTGMRAPNQPPPPPAKPTPPEMPDVKPLAPPPRRAPRQQKEADALPGIGPATVGE